MAGRKECMRRKSCRQEEREEIDGRVVGRKIKKGNVAEGRIVDRKK